MRRFNYATTFLAEGVVVGGYLLAFRLIAAFSGTEGFGEYSLSRRTLSLLMPLAVLGADLGIARYVAYAETERSGKSSGYAGASLIVLAAGVGIGDELGLPQQVLDRRFDRQQVRGPARRVIPLSAAGRRRRLPVIWRRTQRLPTRRLLPNRNQTSREAAASLRGRCSLR